MHYAKNMVLVRWYLRLWTGTLGAQPSENDEAGRVRVMFVENVDRSIDEKDCFSTENISPPLQHKRENVWHNSVRNAVISKLARALVNAQMEPLWEMGMLLDQLRVG